MRAQRVPQSSQRSRPVGMTMPRIVGMTMLGLVDVAMLGTIQAGLRITHSTQDARTIRLQHVDNSDPDASAKDLRPIVLPHVGYSWDTPEITRENGHRLGSSRSASDSQAASSVKPSA